MKKLNNLLKILTAQVITIAIVLALMEVVGQLYAYSNPGYETLSAIPDRTVGWRLAPNLEYIYTGGHWYANEFSAEIKHNALGFRDFNRSTTKPPGTTRIVLLGDSFVAAEQVAFQNTPGQILERLLTQNTNTEQNQIFEVLNFGIGGTGIGQSLLTYRQYAKTFDPDYIFLFIFEGDIWRTISTWSAITNNINSNHQLAIRPVFTLSKNNDQNIFQPLLRVLNFRDFYKLLIDLKTQKLKSGDMSLPTEEEYFNLIDSFKALVTEEKVKQISEKLNQMDLSLYLPKQIVFDEFVHLQNERIKTDMGEDRTRIREHKIFLLDLWKKIEFGLNRLRQMFEPELALKEEFDTLIRTYTPQNQNYIFKGNPTYPNFEKTVFKNLKVLETLNRDIIKESRKFVIVDASAHLVKYGRLPANLLSTILEIYCKVNGIGYIPLYQPLNEAKKKGIKTRWPKDRHFNENGYRIFGEAMFQWIEAHNEEMRT